MAVRNDPTAQYVRSILNYDQQSGIFTWKQRTPDQFNAKDKDAACKMWNGAWSGKQAGSIDKKGYVVIGIRGKLVFAHRLAWIFMTGDVLESEIDHINGNKSDNRIANLRIATASENHANSKLFKSNTSGYKGVTFCKQTGRWLAKIGIRGKIVHLGRFKTKEQAADAYQEAAELNFGDFARME